MGDWKSASHNKYLLQYHLIFVCKYRKKLLINQYIADNMKGYITYHIWESYSAYLCKCFWKEKTFFTDGYFICSVGNVSEKMLKEYIENQG